MVLPTDRFWPKSDILMMPTITLANLFVLFKKIICVIVQTNYSGSRQILTTTITHLNLSRRRHKLVGSITTANTSPQP